MVEEKKKTLFSLCSKLMSIYAYSPKIHCAHVKQTKVYQRILLRKCWSSFKHVPFIDEHKNAPNLYCFIQFGKFQMIMPMIVEQRSQEFRLLLSKLLYKPIGIPIVYSNYSFFLFSASAFSFYFVNLIQIRFFLHNIYKIIYTHHLRLYKKKQKREKRIANFSIRIREKHSLKENNIKTHNQHKIKMPKLLTHLHSRNYTKKNM